MVTGWRRAFCTSFPRDRESAVAKEMQGNSNSTLPSPRLTTKFGFFSNPSTPRPQPRQASSPSLRCRTAPAASLPNQSLPQSPKLQCNTKNSPGLFHRSNPSSPRSPSTFSLLKSSLRLTKQSRCRICFQNVKTGQGTAIFTAECSHSFHFPCIAAHVKKQGSLVCPVCCSTWKDEPLLALHSSHRPEVGEKKTELASTFGVKTKSQQEKQYPRSALKVYDDDEPLMSPTSGARFNPIPESDENDEEENAKENGIQEFRGFLVNGNGSPFTQSTMNSGYVEVKLSPEAAVVSVRRSYEVYAIVLKVRAPPAPATSRRAPIDLVTVLDVSSSMTAEKCQMMKRAMQLVVSSLSSTDRLSIVAFSGSSKRLLPLKRMTANGRLSARRIVDALAMSQGTSIVSDALKKAAKVLEDRRDKNPVASILLLSDGDDGPITSHKSVHQRAQSNVVTTTRFSRLDIPVHSFAFCDTGAYGHSPDLFAKCVGGLLSVVVQDLRLELGFISGSGPAEIAAVYSYTGRPVFLGSGAIRIGDLYAEEEREFLVELKVPPSALGAHRMLSVRCCHREPLTRQLIRTKEQALLVPRPHAVRSSAPTIERLRNLFVATRAVAESRRLSERNDLTGAHHMLSSARALLLQARSASAGEFIRGLEAEMSELHRKHQDQIQQIQRRRTNVVARETAYLDEKGEPLTPTSAWRAAERLAKVAIMRKSLNRVSDLHGFEDARF